MELGESLKFDVLYDLQWTVKISVEDGILLYTRIDYDCTISDVDVANANTVLGIWCELGVR